MNVILILEAIFPEILMDSHSIKLYDILDKYFAIQLGMSKAYNIDEWDFFSFLFVQFNFLDVFINIIMRWFF